MPRPAVSAWRRLCWRSARAPRCSPRLERQRSGPICVASAPPCSTLRTFDFADQVLAATEGQGVRLVLNSLTGAFVGASLRALSKDGVLLELGKREIWTAEEVASSRPDVAYHVFDAGSMAEADPALFQACMTEILPALASSEIAPPPLEVLPLTAAQVALRRIAQAKHMGKLVLALKPSSADLVPVRSDGAYLISGGSAAWASRPRTGWPSAARAA